MTNLKVTITEVPDPLLPDNVIAVIDGTPIVAAGKNKQEVWKELMISLAITIAHNSDLDYKELTADELKDSPYQGSAGVWRSAAKPPGITQWYVVKCEQRRFASLIYVDSKITLERVAKDIDVEIDLLEWLDESAAAPAGDGWVSVQDMPMEMFEASNEGRSETYNITYLYNGTPHVSCGYLLYENWHWLENNKPLSKGFAVTYYRELPSPPNKSV